MNDIWQGCYDAGWQGDIVAEAFAHPAKFSRGLIHRIYKHAKEMGWVKPGDWVLDPFGGVALGGLDALSMGLNWVGVELEPKFMALGKQNIELWQRQLKGWPNLGTARIVQGDSRYLLQYFRADRNADQMIADVIVSSPPYAEVVKGGGKGIDFSKTKRDGDITHQSLKHSQGTGQFEYSKSPNNLGNMPEGNFQDVIEKADLVVSSPPFSIGDSASAQSLEKRKDKSANWIKNNTGWYTGYGHTPGNLANMKEGDIDLVVSSPPFIDQEPSHGQGKSPSTKRLEAGSCKNRNFVQSEYGSSPGQLGSMKEGSFDICVSSPPYESTEPQQDREFINSKNKLVRTNPRHPGEKLYFTYYDKQSSSGNLGNSSGDTFWSASREIVQGCFDLIKPGGHAIWVCKDYVKAKKRVPFSDRWLALCESVGFRLACRHQAMLVKEHGTQTTIHGDKKITTERKSFFRRLAESKGSPRIDWEDILCMVKT